MTFGQKLKYIRKEILHLTQQELADSIHFTQAAVNAVETGKNKTTSFELFRQLVLVHHVNPMYFIYEDSREPAILKRQASSEKAYTKKVYEYEKLVEQLVKVRSGK
jgi:DNA-binding XRE family transcriptional regulator